MAIQTAIEAMRKYAPSYFNANIVPIVREEIYNIPGKYEGEPSCAVIFPFDYRKAIEEGREGEPVYGGMVFILTKTGKTVSMMLSGWDRLFVIDEVSTRGAGHNVAPPITVPRRQFKGWK